MPTLPDELEYSFKPAPARGDFQGCARDQPESAQARDIGQIEILKRALVQGCSGIRNIAQAFFEALFRAYLNPRLGLPLALARAGGLCSDTIL